MHRWQVSASSLGRFEDAVERLKPWRDSNHPFIVSNAIVVHLSHFCEGRSAIWKRIAVAAAEADAPVESDSEPEEA